MATTKEGTKGQNADKLYLKASRTVKPGEGRRGKTKRTLKYEQGVRDTKS